MSKRVFWIVLDSVGCGEAPDAAAFGDAGCDTLGTCVRSGLLDAPNLTKLGLFNIEGTSEILRKMSQAATAECRNSLSARTLQWDTGKWPE